MRIAIALSCSCTGTVGETCFIILASMLRLLDMEQWFSLSIAARAVYIGSCIERNSEARIFAIWGGRCLCLPRVLAMRVLLEVLKTA